MITLPATLSSPPAGPILCRCAPAIVVKTGRRGIVDFVAVDANEHRPGTWARFLYDDDGEERGGYVWGADPLPEPRPLDVIRLAAIGLDLTADLGPTIALRWLGRHYGIRLGVSGPTFTRIDTDWHLEGADPNETIIFAHRVRMDCFKWIIGTGVERTTNPLEALVAACLHAAGVPRE